MTYRVALLKSEEGFSVSVPGLPGCLSQGGTEEEALENIRSAIQEYLEVRDEILSEPGVQLAEVTI
ncbi:MAG: type II toxin-antitoxin system HicB family antitoxin [Bryobacteraceae bacterium]|jgi:predicted RNase H-like HicB family nuclease